MGRQTGIQILTHLQSLLNNLEASTTSQPSAISLDCDEDESVCVRVFILQETT